MSNEERYKEVLAAAYAELNYGNGVTAGQLSRATTLIFEALTSPPQFEEVEVEAWKCPDCGVLFHHPNLVSTGTCCSRRLLGGNLIKLSGKVKREIKPKVKHREDLLSIPESIMQRFPLNTNYYAEWESES